MCRFIFLLLCYLFYFLNRNNLTNRSSAILQENTKSFGVSYVFFFYTYIFPSDVVYRVPLCQLGPLDMLGSYARIKVFISYSRGRRTMNEGDEKIDGKRSQVQRIYLER